MRTAIDYEAQFKTLPLETVNAESRKWKRQRTFLDARQAYRSARASEYAGHSVAFCRVHESGVYVVWSGDFNT